MILYLAFSQQAFWGFALSTLSMIIIVAALATFLVYYHKKLKELLNCNIELHKELLAMTVSSQEEESKRITSDLHDNIGGVLSAAGLYLDQAISNEVESYAEKQMLITSSRKLINEAVHQIRKVSFNVRPYSIGQAGFQKVLHNLLWRIINPAHVQFTTQFESREILFSEEKELLVYRVVQELIPGILKFSEPDIIHVHQYSKADNFILEIIFDGKAIDQQRFYHLVYEKGDPGLKKMISRLEVSDGELLFTKEDAMNKTFFKVPYVDVKSMEITA
jgi:signal transduction histidine kinase